MYNSLSCFYKLPFFVASFCPNCAKSSAQYKEKASWWNKQKKTKKIQPMYQYQGTFKTLLFSLRTHTQHCCNHLHRRICQKHKLDKWSRIQSKCRASKGRLRLKDKKKKTRQKPTTESNTEQFFKHNRNNLICWDMFHVEHFTLMLRCI